MTDDDGSSRPGDSSEPPEGRRSCDLAHSLVELEDAVSTLPPTVDNPPVPAVLSSTAEPFAPTKPTAAPMGHGTDFSISEAPTLETAFKPDRDSDGVTIEQPGRYLVTRALRRGEVGEGSVAFDRHMQREVELRELPVGLADAEVRFITEARVSGWLDHPGIVPVHELGRRADGSLFRISRLVRGQTFDEAVAKQSLGERLMLLPHLLQAADALGFAHAHGVVHRWLTPTEVVVGAWGETLVVGWAAAKVRDQSDVQGTVLRDDLAAARSADVNEARQTLAYLSPEHFRADPGQLDARSDVYSLGALLYLLLTGRPPHEGETPSELVERVLAHRVDSVLVWEPMCPVALVRIAKRALAKRPDRRYADAREFAAALRSWLAERITAQPERAPNQLLRLVLALLLVVVVLGFVAWRWLEQ